jgi:hypothetical protein
MPAQVLLKAQDARGRCWRHPAHYAGVMAYCFVISDDYIQGAPHQSGAGQARVRLQLLDNMR